MSGNNTLTLDSTKLKKIDKPIPFNYFYPILGMQAAFSDNIYTKAPANTIYNTSDRKMVQFFGIFYQDKKTMMYKLLMCECVCDLLFKSKLQEIHNILDGVDKVRCTKNTSCFFTGCKNCHTAIDKKFECPFPCHEYKIKGEVKKTTSPTKCNKQDSMDIENGNLADKPAPMEEVKLIMTKATNK